MKVVSYSHSKMSASLEEGNAKPANGALKNQDEAALARMGYKQELKSVVIYPFQSSG